MDKIIIALIERREDLLKAIMEHIQISFFALVIALMIAVPLGIFLSQHKKAADFVIGISSVMQTIPSLALLGLLIPFVGIGTPPAIIALVIYAVLPILRNTYTGIIGVDPVYSIASKAMGMTRIQRLFKVFLPLSMPVIMAGVRTATVLIIGTATLASLIGAGGLGNLILLGVDRLDNTLIILGAVPAALLALLFDFILKKLENESWKRLLFYFFITTGLFLSGNILLNKPVSHKKLVLSGKQGTEPEILINMYKILIQEKIPDMQFDLKPGLGSTTFVFNALKSGEVDIYTEYSGTVIFTLMKTTPVSKVAEEVFRQAKDGIYKQEKMLLMPALGFNNTYTLAVPRKFSEENNITKISDLERVKDMIKAGFTREFVDREDCYRGFRKIYGFEFPNIREMEPKLRYVAVEKGEINLMDAYATDSEIDEYGLVVLKDDKNLFPPYQGALFLKEKTLKEYPELLGIFEKLGNKINDSEMRRMNREVNENGKKPEEVAREFLKSKNLIK